MGAGQRIPVPPARGASRLRASFASFRPLHQQGADPRRPLEARGWIDVIECVERLQPLGYLAWAAAGKDPGFTPEAILEQAARSSRYTQAEIDSLAFAAPAPSAAELSARWHRHLQAAREVCTLLPPDRVGQAVLTHEGALFKGDAAELTRALEQHALMFHPGRIRGAYPQTKAS